MHQKTCLEGNDCSIEGAIREFWGFKATFFVGIELRKCISKIYLGKIDYSIDFLSSLFINKIMSKP